MARRHSKVQQATKRRSSRYNNHWNLLVHSLVLFSRLCKTEQTQKIIGLISVLKVDSGADLSS